MKKGVTGRQAVLPHKADGTKKLTTDNMQVRGNVCVCACVCVCVCVHACVCMISASECLRFFYTSVRSNEVLNGWFRRVHVLQRFVCEGERESVDVYACMYATGCE
jgi:hypothetical protein